MSGVTIQGFITRCKGVLDDAIGEWGMLALLFLVAACAFGLGRLSALENARPPVSILEAPQAANVPAIKPGGYVVASNTGSVYYFPWCSGAQNIAQEKRVWFDSEEAARQAGYKPSKTCEGLGGE